MGAGDANRAGFFEIDGFWIWVKVLAWLACDATADLNLYALHDRGTVDQVVGKLQALETPDVYSLLAPGDLFVHLSLGIDEAGDDVLVIHSRDELSDRLDPLVEEYRAVIKAYDEHAPSFSSHDEWEEHVAQMLGPQIAALRRVQRH